MCSIFLRLSSTTTTTPSVCLRRQHPYDNNTISGVSISLPHLRDQLFLITVHLLRLGAPGADDREPHLHRRGAVFEVCGGARGPRVPQEQGADDCGAFAETNVSGEVQRAGDDVRRIRPRVGEGHVAKRRRQKRFVFGAG